MAKRQTTMVEELPSVDSAPAKVPIGGAAMRRIKVSINGLPPGLLMSSKGGMAAESERGKQTKIKSAEEQGDAAAYWIDLGNGKRELGLPWICLYKSIVAAAKRFKFKGREAMNKILAATISCEQDLIPLGTDKYKLDSRWGKIPPKTGGTVMLNRPLLVEWGCSLVMIVDDEFYKIEVIPDIINSAGKLVGVCANRPALEGPYGRFRLTGWEVLE